MATWRVMKFTQIAGLFFALIALLSGVWFLEGIDLESSSSAGAGAFFGLLISSVPCLIISALFLVPSSIELLSSNTRNAHGFDNFKWQLLLVVNSLISIGYICIIIFLAYTFIKLQLRIL